MRSAACRWMRSCFLWRMRAFVLNASPLRVVSAPIAWSEVSDGKDLLQGVEIGLLCGQDAALRPGRRAGFLTQTGPQALFGLLFCRDLVGRELLAHRLP